MPPEVVLTTVVYITGKTIPSVYTEKTYISTSQSPTSQMNDSWLNGLYHHAFWGNHIRGRAALIQKIAIELLL
jgi:hypothetical protein